MAGKKKPSLDGLGFQFELHDLVVHKGTRARHEDLAMHYFIGVRIAMEDGDGVHRCYFLTPINPLTGAVGTANTESTPESSLVLSELSAPDWLKNRGKQLELPGLDTTQEDNALSPSPHEPPAGSDDAKESEIDAANLSETA